MDEVVVIQSDWYNAVYYNGKRINQAKPEYLNAETAINMWPGAEVKLFSVNQELYDKYLDGDGYPEKIEDFPLNECLEHKIPYGS